MRAIARFNVASETCISSAASVALDLSHIELANVAIPIADGSQFDREIRNAVVHEGEWRWRCLRPRKRSPADWGDSVEKIKKAMGHSDLTTTQRYMNEADAFGQGFGEVFGALPASLITGPAGPKYRTNIVASASQVQEIIASPGGFEEPFCSNSN